jgi:hypothetical protein
VRAIRCSARWTWSNAGEPTKNVAILRSSPSSEPPPWLGEVYERRRHRTIRLVELSIAALTRAGKRTSLAAIARASKTVDPNEPDGISESAIVHNEEAYALYRQHAEHKRAAQRKPSAEPRAPTTDACRIHVTPAVIVAALVSGNCTRVKPNS